MKKDIRKKTITILGIILITCGIFIITFSLYMRISANNKQKELIQDFEQKLEQQLEQPTLENNNAVEEETTTSSEKTIETNSIVNQENTPVTMGAVGIMEIPKINLKVAIGEGVDMDTLKFAVGHFPETSMPGEIGNFSVAGHRSYTYNKYFNRLDEVTTGDEILVTSLNGKFTYIVDDIKVVEPEEVSVLSRTNNASITLVTCTPVRVATHRLIIKGHLKQ